MKTENRGAHARATNLSLSRWLTALAALAGAALLQCNKVDLEHPTAHCEAPGAHECWEFFSEGAKCSAGGTPVAGTCARATALGGCLQKRSPASVQWFYPTRTKEGKQWTLADVIAVCTAGKGEVITPSGKPL